MISITIGSASIHQGNVLLLDILGRTSAVDVPAATGAILLGGDQVAVNLAAGGQILFRLQKVGDQYKLVSPDRQVLLITNSPNCLIFHATFAPAAQPAVGAHNNNDEALMQKLAEENEKLLEDVKNFEPLLDECRKQYRLIAVAVKRAMKFGKNVEEFNKLIGAIPEMPDLPEFRYIRECIDDEIEAWENCNSMEL